MRKNIKRALAGLLSFLVLATSITPIASVEAAENLVNVALDASASTENTISYCYCCCQCNLSPRLNLSEPQFSPL